MFITAVSNKKLEGKVNIISLFTILELQLIHSPLKSNIIELAVGFKHGSLRGTVFVDHIDGLVFVVSSYYERKHTL